MVESRRAAWKTWTNLAWSTDKGAIYDLVREGEKRAVAVLARPDGSLTGDIEEMDLLLRKHWLPVFQRYSTTNPEPQWADFVAIFGAHIPRGSQLDLGPITPEALRDTIQRISGTTSTGADGWCAKEQTIHDQSQVCPIFTVCGPEPAFAS